MTNNDFDKSQGNGCQSQEKVRIFVFFATWKLILVKNGLTFIAVILFIFPANNKLNKFLIHCSIR